jgi:hypothetical protein
MSLRDDITTPAFDDPTALHHEPLGNGAGLSDFHTVNVEEKERSNTPKIVGAVAVALMVGVAAVGLYANMGHSTKPVVADNAVPKTVPVTPPQQTAMAAPDSNMSAPAPDTSNSAAPTTPAPTPEPAATKTEPSKPAPVHTASRSSSHIKSASSEPASDAASVRMSADTTQTTQAPQQAQVTPAQQAQATPLPAAPTPSPSDVASNGGQSSAAVPNNATTASDIPQPQAAPAPAQPQTPAQTTQQPEATPAPAPAQ